MIGYTSAGARLIVVYKGTSRFGAEMVKFITSPHSCTTATNLRRKCHRPSLPTLLTDLATGTKHNQVLIEGTRGGIATTWLFLCPLLVASSVTAQWVASPRRKRVDNSTRPPEQCFEIHTHSFCKENYGMMDTPIKYTFPTPWGSVDDGNNSTLGGSLLPISFNYSGGNNNCHPSGFLIYYSHQNIRAWSTQQIQRFSFLAFGASGFYSPSEE